MPKVDKRETVRSKRVAKGLSRVLRVRAALGLRATGRPAFNQTGLRSLKKREDLEIQHEDAVPVREAREVRLDENRIEREVVSEGRLRDREDFETLCDASMDC